MTTRLTRISPAQYNVMVSPFTLSAVTDDPSPSGWCSWWSHPELPAGEVPCGPPEPRREKLPHLLPAGGGRGGRSAALARPGEKLPAVQIPSAGQGANDKHKSHFGATKVSTPFICCPLQGDCAKVSSISDKSVWKTVRKALSVIEFSESDVEVRKCTNSQPAETGQIHASFIFWGEIYEVVSPCLQCRTCLALLPVCSIWGTSDLKPMVEDTHPSTATRSCTGCQR